MTELSTLGGAALYDHMVEALASRGTGKLNKKSLLQSADVTDDDLHCMINIVCDAGGNNRLQMELASRQELVDTLAELVEHVSCMPGLVDSDVQPTLRSNNPDSTDNPSLLQPQTERAHAIAQGPASMTRTVLHMLRVAAGWESHTKLGGGKIAGKKALHEIIEKYLQKQQAEGLTEAQAREKMQREYIAQDILSTSRPSASYVARHRLIDIPECNITQHHIDLSPQAIEDFHQAMQRRQEEKSQGPDVYNLFKRYGMPLDNRLARTIVHNAWEKEVTRLTAKDGMSREQAELNADKEYLNHHCRIDRLKLNVNLSPRAYNDIGNAVIQALLDREKAGRS